MADVDHIIIGSGINALVAAALLSRKGDSVLVVDCPGPLHQGVLRRLKRFGFRVEGAEPGDGTVYRFDMWLNAG